MHSPPAADQLVLHGGMTMGVVCGGVCPERGGKPQVRLGPSESLRFRAASGLTVLARQRGEGRGRKGICVGSRAEDCRRGATRREVTRKLAKGQHRRTLGAFCVCHCALLGALGQGKGIAWQRCTMG